MAAAPESINTNVHYFLSPEDGGQPPVYLVGTVGARRRTYQPQPVTITNLRGKEEFFSLDIHGFELANSPTAQKDFTNDEKVKEYYYREVEKMIKERTGASYVYIFSHVVRSDPISRLQQIPKEARDDEPFAVTTPAMFAHVDQSYKGAKTLIDAIAKNNADAADIPDRIKNHRWAIINAWRPLKTITREPLAVCDARTVAESDLREVTLRIPKELAKAHQGFQRGSQRDSPYGPDLGDPMKWRPSQYLWQIAANPRHKWYWPSAMQPEEVLLIKCFDSRTDVARRAPHSAIQTPMDQGPARQSIEARCIVVWEDQPTTNERAML